jgi:hypothetical protein
MRGLEGDGWKHTDTRARRGEAGADGMSVNREEGANVARVLIVYHPLSGNTKAAAGRK